MTISMSMMRVVSASPPTATFSPIQLHKTQSAYFCNPCTSVPVPRTSPFSSDLSLQNHSFGGARLPQRSSLYCRSSTGPGASGSGESDSRGVLDAFFLGKALAETLNERIESTIGEILSTIGRLQAEQQKQVQDFQNEVLERAQRAKEKAAREAMEAQGLVSKSTAVDTTSVTNGSPSTTLREVTGAATSASSYTSETNPDPAKSGRNE